MTSLTVSTASSRSADADEAQALTFSSSQQNPAVMVSPTQPPDVDDEVDVEDEDEPIRLGHLSATGCRYARVVGIRYYRGVAHPGEYVTLVREPTNPYDRNAVRVDNLRGEKVGHIKRELAVRLSKLMDSSSSSDIITMDASIPPRISMGNVYELPVELTFYGPAHLESLVQTTFQSMVPKYKQQKQKQTKTAKAATVVVQSRNVDWKQAQQQLDDMFVQQVAGQLQNLPPVDTMPPLPLSSTLLAHQQLGMRWMVQQETTGDNKVVVPFYSKRTENGKTVWFCEITRASQPNKPEPVRGGILADDMGLGKTLQTIALLLAHPPQGRDYNQPLVVPSAVVTANSSTTEMDSDTKPPAVKTSYPRPTKTAVQKVKLTPLQAVLRAANLSIPMGSKKADLVKAVMTALDDGGSSSLSPELYHTTLVEQQEQQLLLDQHQAAAAAANRTPVTTLIVCPVSVMSNWQTQINDHVQPNTLRVAVYHGTERKELISQLDQIDVLIVSYGTLQTDYVQDLSKKTNDSTGTSTTSSTDPPAAKRPKTHAGDSIFDANFHRIVLDEAHTVRNPKSRTFQACKSVQAVHRWCLTGTPLQNKPEDIQSLWQFLRVPPLGDAQVFRRAISQPIKEGQEEGLARLRAMMAHVALRRNKSMVTDIQMVSKDIQIRSVQIDDASTSRHQQIHDTLFDSAKAAFSAVLRGGNERALQTTQTASVVFEVLTRLRQACCSGALVPKERLQRAEEVLAAILEKKAKSDQQEEQPHHVLTAEEGLLLLDKLKGALEEGEDGPPDCAVCLEPLTETAAVALRACGHVFCQGCIGRVAQTSGHCPFCRQSFVKDDMIAWTMASKAVITASQEEQDKNDGNDEAKAPSLLSQQMDQLGPSPKMEAMLAALQELQQGEKVVIFSQFTKFLDEIQPFLATHGYSTARIDGKKTAAQRLEALTVFSKEDGGPTIMLCSLHAAGTGINLTRANHVFMMDTWFNLSVEQQAMDRVHRIGQTRPVRILRFVTADSVESRMLSLQEAKAALGKGAFENLSADEKKKARLGDVKKLLQLCDE